MLLGQEPVGLPTTPVLGDGQLRWEEGGGGGGEGGGRAQGQRGAGQGAGGEGRAIVSWAPVHWGWATEGGEERGGERGAEATGAGGQGSGARVWGVGGAEGGVPWPGSGHMGGQGLGQASQEHKHLSLHKPCW